MIPSIVVLLPIGIRHRANSSAIVCRVLIPDKSSAAERICRMASELSLQTSGQMAVNGNNLLTSDQMGHLASSLPINALTVRLQSVMPFNREHQSNVLPQRRLTHSRVLIRADNKSIEARQVWRQRAARMGGRNRSPVVGGIGRRSIVQVAVVVIKSTVVAAEAVGAAEQVETDKSCFRTLCSCDQYHHLIQGPSC